MMEIMSNLSQHILKAFTFLSGARIEKLSLKA